MIKLKLNGLACLIVEPDTSSAQILAAKLINGGFSSSHIHSLKTALELVESGVEGQECRIASRRELEEKPNDKNYKIVAKFLSIEPRQRQSLRLKTQEISRKSKKSEEE